MVLAHLQTRFSSWLTNVRVSGIISDMAMYLRLLGTGTLDYMAPEVLRCPPKMHPEDNKHMFNLQYTNTVDSWAVGVLAYELLVGFPPFASNCSSDSMLKIMSGSVVFPKRMSEEAKAFIDGALQAHPGDRTTVTEMLCSAWLIEQEVGYHAHLVGSRVFDQFASCVHS